MFVFCARAAALASFALLCSTGFAQPDRGPFPDGLWMSDGYGDLLEIHGDHLQLFEITSISCVPSFTATRRPAGSSGDSIFTIGDAVLHVKPGSTPNDAREHFEGNVSEILLHRVSAKPKTCAQKPGDNPQENYAILWQTFAENYAFFDLRHVDWQATDRQFRPQVKSDTPAKELFRIFQAMIEPLQDAHTGISAKGIGRFTGRRPDPNHLGGDQWAQAKELIQTKYIQGGFKEYCQGHVQFGMLRDVVGYLRVDSFGGFAKGGYADELEALITALDASLRNAPQFRGLMIDVRRNTGGYDPLGVEIASRLTSQKYLAYSKVTRDNLNGPLHFTAPQETWVTPSARPGFSGKVVLLTGPDTISAGETFAMALMNREPHVTRIGQNTQGVFSDVLDRALPNGWNFHMPNEVYLTKDGKAFDGPGIPPDVKVAFFSAEDLAAGRDAAIDRALTIISGR